MAKLTEKEMEMARKAAEERMRTVDVQYDSVYVEKASTLGYYTAGNDDNGNTITVNYALNNNDHNKKAIFGTTLIHEQKHRDNYLQGMYAYPISPEQAQKRYMHDEISANMAQLVALRDKYIQTGDISVFDKDRKFSFYKEAIEKGEINPKSPYKEDFDKDMSLIMNGTQKMWQDKYARADVYVDIGLNYRWDGDSGGKYAAYWEENYNNSLKIAYNIGGIDFTKYMKEDVEIPKEANLAMMKKIIDSPSYQNFYHLSDAEVFAQSGFSQYDGSISLSEYKRLLQYQMATNDSFSGHVSADKNSTTKNYQQAFQKTAQREEFIDKMVEYQALEYAKTGKKFPNDNEDNYKKILDKKYSGAYDVLKQNENNVHRNLSDKTLKIQKETNKKGSLASRLVNLTQYFTHPTDTLRSFNADQSAIKNEPTSPVNKKAPEYRTWKNEDGSRVSDVQYVQILDLTKPIIKQPTKSRQNSQQPKDKMIASMKRDAANAKKKMATAHTTENKVTRATQRSYQPKTTVGRSR